MKKNKKGLKKNEKKEFINNYAIPFNNETIIDKIKNKNISEYLWNNVYMTQKFEEFFKNENSYSIQINKKIEEILNGNFSDIEEKIHYYKKFLYATYLYKFSPSNLNLLYTIYFKKNSMNEYDETLLFIDIDNSIQSLKNSILEFREEMIKNNNQNLEFDRFGLMEKSNIFYSQIKYENGIKQYFPFPYSIIEKSEKYKQIKLFDKKIVQKVDFSIWKLDSICENVLIKINSLTNLRYDEIFINHFLDFIPSEKEKELINNNKNFILAGRPGTGKTFIILIKTILIYLNCLI